MLLYVKHITRKMLRDNLDTLFVFGDNLARHGLGGQAKEMRGEPNAVGIPTKNFPGNGVYDFFSDDDLPDAKPFIDKAFKQLINHLKSGKNVIWPFYGIGTGLADLENKAPKIAKYIDLNLDLLEQAARE